MGDKAVLWKSLAMRVIVVAVEGEVKDWAAYIDAVAGDNHIREWQEVRRRGTKLPREVAEILFPKFKHLEWRY